MELLQRSTIWRHTQKENHEEARMARSRFLMQGDVITDSPAGLWVNIHTYWLFSYI